MRLQNCEDIGLGGPVQVPAHFRFTSLNYLVKQRFLKNPPVDLAFVKGQHWVWVLEAVSKCLEVRQ